MEQDIIPLYIYIYIYYLSLCFEVVSREDIADHGKICFYITSSPFRPLLRYEDTKSFKNTQFECQTLILQTNMYFHTMSVNIYML